MSSNRFFSIYFKQIALGWGATEFSLGHQSEFLVQLDVTVNSSTNNYFVLETNVGQFGGDPCDGDSGGPLLLKDEHEWTIVGTLIGGGFDCSQPFDRKDNTSDWNKVSIHMPWIRSIIYSKSE